MSAPPITALALSGSLRAGSSNTALLRAAAAFAPADVEVVLDDGLGELPHFNPDLDEEGSHPPPAVAALRALVSGAHGYLISTPEYAHGDQRQPTGGRHAHASLREILRTMSAQVLPEASLMTPFSRSRLGASGNASDPALRDALARCVDRLAAVVDVARLAPGRRLGLARR